MDLAWASSAAVGKCTHACTQTRPMTASCNIWRPWQGPRRAGSHPGFPLSAGSHGHASSCLLGRSVPVSGRAGVFQSSLWSDGADASSLGGIRLSRRRRWPKRRHTSSHCYPSGGYRAHRDGAGGLSPGSRTSARSHLVDARQAAGISTDDAGKRKCLLQNADRGGRGSPANSPGPAAGGHECHRT